VKSFSPQAKIILYALLVIAVFISHSYKISLFLLCCVAVFAFRIPLLTLKGGAVPIFFFLTFTFISNVLFHEGEKIYQVFGLSVSEEGLLRGGQLTLRLFILILGAKVLTATTKAEDLVTGMSVLLGPVGKIGFVKDLVFTMSLTLRLLPMVYNEAVELYRDVKNSEGTSLAGKVKLSVSLLTPLFERSLKKAEEISQMGEKR
jgi:energy-coupling factor transport system permease protein